MKMYAALPQHFQKLAQKRNFELEGMNEFISDFESSKFRYVDSLEIVQFGAHTRLVLWHEDSETWYFHDWNSVQFVKIKNSKIYLSIGVNYYSLLWTNQLAITLYPHLHLSDLIALESQVFISQSLVLQLQAKFTNNNKI